MKKLPILLFLSLMTAGLFASSDAEFRTSATVRFSPFKRLNVYLSPECRFRPDRLDKIIAQAEVKFKAHRNVDVGGAYKFITNFDGSWNAEFIHRFDLYVELEADWKRFTPGFRMMYSSYDEEEGASNFMRYKLKLDYNIPKSKIDPTISAELYHQPSTSTYYKMRYSIGADWRFAKKQSIGLTYKLDDYLGDTKWKHVFELGYSYKF